MIDAKRQHAKVRHSSYTSLFLSAVFIILIGTGAQFLPLASEMRTHAKASQTLRNRNARILPARRKRLVYLLLPLEASPTPSLRLVTAIFPDWENQNALFCASSIGTIRVITALHLVLLKLFYVELQIDTYQYQN